MKRIILAVLLLGLAALIPYGLWRDVRLFALSAESGRVVWSRSLPNDKEWVSNPQFGEDKVFVWAGPKNNKTLFAFDARNGKRSWSHGLGDYVAEAEFYANTLNLARGIGVYRNTGSAELVALELATGQERWRVSYNTDENYSNDYKGYVLSNESLDKIITVKLEGDSDNPVATIRAYSLQGELLWNVPTTAYRPHYQEAIFGDDEAIYIAPGYIYKLDSGTGELLFTAKVDADGGFGFDGTTLYGAWGQRLSAVDAATGTILWHYDEAEMHGLLQYPVVGETIYVTYSVLYKTNKTTGEYFPDSWLFAISKEGKELWRRAISSSGSDSLDAFGQIPALLPGGAAVIGETALMVFNEDGSERWQFPLDASNKSAGSYEGLVYVTAEGARYKHWLAHLNPAWH